MKSSDYFARRTKLLTEKLLDGINEEYIKNLNEIYGEAIHDTEIAIRAWYQRFADNNGISYAEAQKLLTSDELAELKWTVKEYEKFGHLNAVTGGLLEKQLENASAKWHISRLESIKMQVQTHADKLADKLLGSVKTAAKFAYSEAYYRNAFEVQKGIGVGVVMQGTDERRLEKLLSKPWTADDKTFSARIWKDRTQLVDTVSKELTRMTATGEAPDKAIKAISERFSVSKSNAGRLVMTESAYLASEAQKDCFKELGVEKYKVVAALDGNTCPVCGAMDGKIFDIDEYKPGSTAEPFHPRCRCCTSPFFEDTDNVGTRIARDVKTGKSFELPADTTYEQWKEMQDGKYGEETVDIERKKAYNEKADRQQFEAYKNRLGADSPKTYKDFRTLKYESPTDYEELCGLYSYKGRVPEATATDYRTYKAIKSLGVKGVVRVPAMQTQHAYVLEDLSSKRDPAHVMHRMMERNLTSDGIQSYVDTALFSSTQFNGTRRVFYSSNGVTVLTRTKDYDGIEWIVKTAWDKTDFDEVMEAAIKEVLNNEK